MKKLNSTILTIMSTCLASGVNAAKMCLGTPVVLATGISLTCGLLITSISVTCAASSVGIGSTISCSANVQPNNASDKGVTWSSNPPGVASVDSSGVVTGVTAGNVTITATAVDGSNVSRTTSIEVVAGGNSHANLSSICSGSGITSYFPYTKCLGSDYVYHGSGYNNASDVFEGRRCPTLLGEVTIYGNSKCSNDNMPASMKLWSSNPVPVSWEPFAPPNPGGTKTPYCWCRLCSDSNRTSCGAWVFRHDAGVESACMNSCAGYCAGLLGGMGCNISDEGFCRAYRIALCAAP